MWDWLKEKTSARSLFGPNSMFAEALKTAGEAGVSFKGLNIQGSADVGIANDEYIKLGILAGFIWLVTRK